MRRQRRNTLISPNVESESNVENESNDETLKTPAKRTSRAKSTTKKVPTALDDDNDDDNVFNNSDDARAARMSAVKEEFFVKLCVKYFDGIHCKSTLRALPTASKMKTQRDQINQAYEGLTREMNEFTKVKKRTL